MESKSVVAITIITLLVGGVFAMSYSVADAASHRLTLEERRAERAAAREARLAEREAARAERIAAREARRAERRSSEPACSCSARVKFSQPSLHWQGGSLVFVPRVDIDIRTRGNVVTDPAWKAVLSHTGQASFNSTVIPYSGETEVAGGPCGNNRYSFTGYQLPSVPLTPLARDLLSGQSVDGNIRMQAKIQGCGFDDESRAFNFTLKEFGNLDIGRWRIAR